MLQECESRSCMGEKQAVRVALRKDSLLPVERQSVGETLRDGMKSSKATSDLEVSNRATSDLEVSNRATSDI